MQERLPGATRRRRKARAFVLNVDWKAVGSSAPGPERARAAALSSPGNGLLVVGVLIIRLFLSCGLRRQKAIACP